KEQAEKLLATLPAAESAATTPVAATVLFAAAALNGLVIYVFTLLHAIDASMHTIVLLWILSLAPLAYVLRQASFTVLLTILFFLWIGLFVHGSVPVLDAID